MFFLSLIRISNSGKGARHPSDMPAAADTPISAYKIIMAGRMRALQRIVAIPQRLIRVPGIRSPNTADNSTAIYRPRRTPAPPGTTAAAPSTATTSDRPNKACPAQ